MSAISPSSPSSPSTSFADSGNPVLIFEILAKLGEGSYGSVFKALDKRDNQLVAIKVLQVESSENTDLLREISILKDCKSEYIVAYKGSYEFEGCIWIVMEMCELGSLCDLMAICERVLTEQQIGIIMRDCLLGLQYLHSRKKIHRDIKSGNCLVSKEGLTKLSDFGVSVELATTMSKRKTVIGTPYWMAPEVLLSSEYNSKCDIWSCLAGESQVEMHDGTACRIDSMTSAHRLVNSYESNVNASGTTTTSGGLVPQMTTGPRVLFRGIKSCIELLLDDGTTLIATPDHLIQTMRGTKRVDELQLDTDRCIVGPKAVLDESCAREQNYSLLLSNSVGLIPLAMSSPADRRRILAFWRIAGLVFQQQQQQQQRHQPQQNQQSFSVIMSHALDRDSVLIELLTLLGEHKSTQIKVECIKQANAVTTRDEFDMLRPTAIDSDQTSDCASDATELYRITLPSALVRDLSALGCISAVNPQQSTQSNLTTLPDAILASTTPRAVVREFFASMYGATSSSDQEQCIRTNVSAAASFRSVQFCTAVPSQDAQQLSQLLESQYNQVLLHHFELQGKMQIQQSLYSNRDSHNSVTTLAFEFAPRDTLQFADQIGVRMCAQKRVALALTASQQRATQTRHSQLLRIEREIEERLQQHNDFVSDRDTVANQVIQEFAQNETLFPDVVQKIRNSISSNSNSSCYDAQQNSNQQCVAFNFDVNSLFNSIELSPPTSKQTTTLTLTPQHNALPCWSLRVVAMRAVTQRPTYDICLSDSSSHLFQANSIVVHNCGITAIELAVGEPPHSNVHPMRAIFLIPHSPSPTLPDPSAYSADFNDFLRLCLEKDPEKRPSASELLASHPFITKCGPQSVMKKLVAECQPEIDEYRAQEAAEASQKQEAAAQQGTSAGTLRQSGSDNSTQMFGTMQSTMSGGTMHLNDGTLQRNPALGSAGANNANNATLKQAKGAAAGGGGGKKFHQDATMSLSQIDAQGTMLFNQDTHPQGTLRHQSESTNSQSSVVSSGANQRGSAVQAEPAYMAHMRDQDSKDKAASAQAQIAEQQAMQASQRTQAAKNASAQPSEAAKNATLAAQIKFNNQQATLKPGAVSQLAGDSQSSSEQESSSAAAPIAASLASETFDDFYKRQRELHSSTLNASTPADIKAAIAALSKAYDEEKAQLKQFYNSHEKTLKQLLKAKEKEAKR